MEILGMMVAFTIMLAGCGGGGGGGSDDVVYAPSITIESPTSSPTYFTTRTSVRIGGTISNASFVHVRNELTGVEVEGYVFYNQGLGTWFADVVGLGFGDNPILVIADADGTGISTSIDRILITRPLEPLAMIFNGPNIYDSSSYWIDTSSFNDSHKIAIFANGTGRSTTGSVFTDEGGAVADFTWTKIAPDAILITNCPSCSFQKISRISGSLYEQVFFGEIETIGGVSEIALHGFILSPGNL